MKLEQWLSVPVARSNTATIATTLFGMLCTVALGEVGQNPESLARKIASLMAALHGVQHVLTILCLKAMARHGAPRAAEALAAYANPYRVSHLDVAVAWVGFFALARYGVGP
jgi:hypothetical protein